MIDINLLHLLLLLFFRQRACHVGCSAGSTRSPPTPTHHPPPSRDGGEMPALRSLQCWKRRLSLSLRHRALMASVPHSCQPQEIECHLAHRCAASLISDVLSNES